MAVRNVVWIASYPKSGNTWIHTVLRAAGATHGFPAADMDVYRMLSSGQAPEICPAVRPDLADGPCSVLKTHAPYARGVQLHDFPDIELVNAARIYIYRNPMDTLLSYLNFTRLEYVHYLEDADYKRTLFLEILGFNRIRDYEEWLGIALDAIPRKNLDHALDYFAANNLLLEYLSPTTWQDNIASWMDAGNDMPGHVVRYEDCMEDSANIAKLADLFVFAPDEVLAALHSVNSNARHLAASGEKQYEVFYNKMRTNYYPEYFSPKAIDRFFSQHEALLDGFGYAKLINAA